MAFKRIGLMAGFLLLIGLAVFTSFDMAPAQSGSWNFATTESEGFIFTDWVYAIKADEDYFGFRVGETTAKCVLLQWMATAEYGQVETYGRNYPLTINASELRIQDVTNAVTTISGELRLESNLEQSVGSDIASASSITLGVGNVFKITGIADIDSIDTASSQASGSVIYLYFTGNAGGNGVVDGKNLNLAGNFAYAGATNDIDILCLLRISNLFIEVSRSAN